MFIATACCHLPVSQHENATGQHNTTHLIDLSRGLGGSLHASLRTTALNVQDKTVAKGGSVTGGALTSFPRDSIAQRTTNSCLPQLSVMSPTPEPLAIG